MTTLPRNHAFEYLPSAAGDTSSTLRSIYQEGPMHHRDSEIFSVVVESCSHKEEESEDEDDGESEEDEVICLGGTNRETDSAPSPSISALDAFEHDDEAPFTCDGPWILCSLDSADDEWEHIDIDEANDTGCGQQFENGRQVNKCDTITEPPNPDA